VRATQILVKDFDHLSCWSFCRSIQGVRQGGAIPAATESLNQSDRVHHAAAENVNRGQFIESAALWAVVTSK